MSPLEIEYPPTTSQEHNYKVKKWNGKCIHTIVAKTDATVDEISVAARQASKNCDKEAELEFIKLGGDAK